MRRKLFFIMSVIMRWKSKNICNAQIFLDELQALSYNQTIVCIFQHFIFPKWVLLT